MEKKKTAQKVEKKEETSQSAQVVPVTPVVQTTPVVSPQSVSPSVQQVPVQQQNPTTQPVYVQQPVQYVQVNQSHKVRNITCCCGGCGCLAILLLVILPMFFSFFSFFLPPGLMMPFGELLSGNNGLNSNSPFSIPGQSSVPSFSLTNNAKTVESNGNFATIEGGGSHSLAALAQNKWPMGGLGEVYEITPTGQFNEPAQISVDLKKDPTDLFSLGYFDQTAKKWTLIPTVRTIGNAFKARINHASIVGGFVPSLSEIYAYTPKTLDASGMKLWSDLKVQYKLLYDRQNQGITTGNDVYINQIRILLTQIIDKLFGMCPTNKSFEYQSDYLFFMYIAQSAGINDVSDKLVRNFLACIPPVSGRNQSNSKASYLISQIDDVPLPINLPGVATANIKSLINSFGIPTEAGNSGKLGWQKNWMVNQHYAMTTNVNFQFNMRGITSSSQSDQANSESTNVLLFSLANVKQGEKFKLYSKFVSTPINILTDDPWDMQWYYGNHQLLTVHNTGTTTSSPSAGDYTYDATLVSDLGKEGAVIKYGGEVPKEMNDILNQEKALIGNHADLQALVEGMRIKIPEMTLFIKPAGSFTTNPTPILHKAN